LVDKAGPNVRIPDGLTGAGTIRLPSHLSQVISTGAVLSAVYAWLLPNPLCELAAPQAALPASRSVQRSSAEAVDDPVEADGDN
jgi:hypothetical protein